MTGPRAIQEEPERAHQLRLVPVVVVEQRRQQPGRERAAHVARHRGQQQRVRVDLVAGNHAAGAGLGQAAGVAGLLD
ncbi:hypothetical protein [Nonomuraea polychroma]|uniref:hypothetical protein n=1 Tax=Nonomuraea polychroma TaxID=46176 RepID=UPI0013E3B304|nr:hypothetical protein [Nonomuraea polychroma]